MCHNKNYNKLQYSIGCYQICLTIKICRKLITLHFQKFVVFNKKGYFNDAKNLRYILLFEKNKQLNDCYQVQYKYALCSVV